ncbi:MAG: hypothetical protein CL537_05005 [Alcanivoracaceae bacterium]|nr:hypothetical protein [Alcanivoracaceae bacterium]|tara:strand:- start:560 stop:1294 length:735 start_codon:yes stop_codon:yes gene_type:complete
MLAQSDNEPEENDRSAWVEWKERMRGKPADYLKKYCGSCQKCVVNANNFSESQISAMLQVNPEICLHLSDSHPELTIKKAISEENDWECGYQGVTQKGLPIIQTARSLAAVEDGVRRGYRPVFVASDYSGYVGRKRRFSYWSKANVVLCQSDFRGMVGPLSGYEGGVSSIMVRHDDDRHPSPLAAYMIPDDIKPGDKVYVADIIEEIVGQHWNQGDSWRKISAEAVWNGEALDMNYCEPIMMMG